MLLRVAGGVFAAAMGAGFALLQATSTPGLWPFPVTFAAVGNLFLIWFVRSTVELRWAWLLPAVPWFVVMVASVSSTNEGDRVANSWTGLATFAVGAFAFFIPVALGTPPQPGAAPPQDLG